MDSGGMKWYIVLGLFLLVVAFGAGGYYVGKYIDTKAMEGKGDTVEDQTLSEVYRNDSLKISFEYPRAWTVKEDLSGDVKTVTLLSTSSSELTYRFDSTVENHEYQYCDSADVEGKDELAEKCTFITGKNGDYGRFEDLEKDPDGMYWNIAEQGDDKLSNWYRFSKTDGFSFHIKGSNEASVFDQIVKSIRRL